MIEVRELTKSFGKKTVLDQISFTADGGSVFGLLGYNGAGKTTLLKIAAGVYMPDSGSVLLDGKSSSTEPAGRQSLFFLSDSLYFPGNASVEKAARFYANYIPAFSMQTFQKLMQLFGLPERKAVRTFSKGMRRQAEMVLALSAHPKYILCDECFDGLDPSKRKLVKDLLLDYVQNSGAAVIVSSHNLNELSDFCGRIGLINKNKLVLDLDTQSLAGRYCRITVRVPREKESALRAIADIRIQKGEEDGVYLLSTAGNVQDVLEQLRALEPAELDSRAMTLEEVFLSYMEENNYDYADIFN